MIKEYTISLFWDDDAAVWVATSEDYPLVLESGSLDLLIERVRVATPEILELNGIECNKPNLRFKAERLMQAV